MTLTGPLEQRVGAVTQRQRGRITRAQLRTVGLSDKQIQRRVRRRALVREHPSVYIDALMPDVPWGPETGALLSMRAGTLLSHASAAALWNLGPPDGEIHVLTPGGWIKPRVGVRLHRTIDLPPRDISARENLPATSPARTLRDCATTCMPHQLERMFTEALTLRLVTLADIREAIAHTRGRDLRHLLDAEITPARLRSDTERRLLTLIRQAKLPEPRVNERLHGFEPDLYWPECRLVVEVDSYGFHTTRWAYERDRRKDATFRARDITTMRFSRRQILDEPLLVIAQIARGLGAP